MQGKGCIQLRDKIIKVTNYQIYTFMLVIFMLYRTTSEDDFKMSLHIMLHML